MAGHPYNQPGEKVFARVMYGGWVYWSGISKLHFFHGGRELPG
jgi:hypothetical protein